MLCFMAIGARGMYLKTFDLKHGMPNSTVKCIQQDKRGFLWMATFGGLCRFDGEHFDVFRNDAEDSLSLGKNHLEVLLVDDECLWIGGDEVMDRLDFKTRQFQHYKPHEGAYFGRVRRLAKLKNTLFVHATTNELYYIPEGKTEMTAVKGFEDDPVMDIIPWNEDHLLVCTYKNLVLFDVKTHQMRQIGQSNIVWGADVTMYYDTAKGRLYMGGSLGYETNSYELNREGRFQRLSLPLPRDVKSICKYGDSIYFATDGNGLYMLDSERGGVLHVPTPELKTDAIHALYDDCEGNLWLGMYRGGVGVYNPQSEWFKSVADRHAKNVTTAVGVIDDELLMGQDGNGLTIYNKVSGKVEHYSSANSSLMGDNVISAQVDGKKIWLAVYGKGISCFDTETRRFTNYPLPSNSRYMWQVADDRLGSLWVVGDRRVAILDKATGQVKEFEVPGGYHARGIEMTATHIWLYTDDGMLKLRKDDRQLVKEYGSEKNSSPWPKGLLKYYVPDSQGQLWLAPEESGLYRFNEETQMLDTIRLNTTHPVVNVQEDHQGKFWISTQYGLYLYDPVTRVQRLYRTGHDFTCSQFCFNASCQQGDTIYLGTIEGPVWFCPNEVNQTKRMGRAYFTGMEVLSGEQMKRVWLDVPDETITLAHDQNFFTISYTYPTCVAQNEVKYEAYLEPFEKDWKPMGSDRELRYTNVPPGSYTLHLRACDEQHQWTSEESSLVITVLRPWWQQWWAMIIWTILIIGILVLSLYVYLHELELKHRMHIKEVEANSQKELDEAKMTFLTQVAHELRTPIFLISATIEELLSVQQNVLRVPRSSIMNLYRNSQRLNKLVSKVIDVRRQDFAVQRLDERAVNVRDFCLQMEDDIRMLCDQKNISFEMHIPEERCVAYLDADKLETILNNLVSNAFKYTQEEGRVSLTLQVVGDDKVTFSVEDNGIGISEELQGAIFDEYYRVKSSSNVYGDGIGLAHVKQLAEIMGGEITLRSEVGKGSCFTLVLPIKHVADDGETESVVLPDVTVLPPSPTTLCTILIVDDEKEVQETLRRYLGENFRIITADNGEEGWKMVQERQPDLVITDLTMPQMDGNQLLTLIKDNSRTAHIPVMMLTAKESEEDKFEAYQRGADAYVTKPISLRYLALRINNLLERAIKVAEMVPTKTNEETHSYTQEEKNFLLTCREIMEQHLAEVDFDVEMMAQCIGMSHSSLYRKIRQITGMSVKDLVNEYRIKRACQMIKSGETNVSTLCEKCGFAEARSFTRAFKQKMDMTPKQYMNKA